MTILSSICSKLTLSLVLRLSAFYILLGILILSEFPHFWSLASIITHLHLLNGIYIVYTFVNTSLLLLYIFLIFLFINYKLSLDIFNKMPISIIEIRRLEPPYDKNGRVTPVTGIKPTTTIKLRIVWKAMLNVIP